MAISCLQDILTMLAMICRVQPVHVGKLAAIADPQPERADETIVCDSIHTVQLTPDAILNSCKQRHAHLVAWKRSVHNDLHFVIVQLARPLNSTTYKWWSEPELRDIMSTVGLQGFQRYRNRQCILFTVQKPMKP